MSAARLLRSPCSDRMVGAVLFDLDGTLYDQRQLRRRMARELLQLLLRRPVSGLRDIRIISAYRHAQEMLRGGPIPDDIELAQLHAAAEQAGVPIARARDVIDEWMHRRPQRHLLRCRAPGLVPFLTFLRHGGIPVGVFSDYRVSDKLRSLEIDHFFSLAVCAADRDVGAFKPSPAGFLRACTRFGLEPARVLYIGDRYEVDGVGAVGAGLDAVIVSRRDSRVAPAAGCRVVRSIVQLHAEMERRPGDSTAV